MRDKATTLTVRNRCQILLDMDESHGKQYLEEQCSKRCAVHIAMESYTVKEFAETGLDACLTLNRSFNSDNARRKVDGRAEAQLIALACGPVPEGHARWTLRLLEEKAKVILADLVSHDTIRRTLINELRPHKNDYWCLLKKKKTRNSKLVWKTFLTYTKNLLTLFIQFFVWMRSLISCSVRRENHFQ